MKASYRTRVRRGMKLLDEVRPGWEQEIDLKKFDINNPCTCTLGQLFGGYGRGVSELDLWHTSYTYGFALNVNDRARHQYEEREQRYERLNEVWLELLSARVHGNQPGQVDTDTPPVLD